MTDDGQPGRVTGPVVPKKKKTPSKEGDAPVTQTTNQASNISQDAADVSSESPGKVLGPTRPKPKAPIRPPVHRPPPVDPQKTNRWLSAFWLMIGALGVWSIGSASLTIVELWREQPIVALPVSIAALAIIVLLARALWDEWLALRDLDALSKRQEELKVALHHNDIGGIKAAMQSTLENLKARGCVEAIAFEKSVVNEKNAARYLSRLDSSVLSSLDNEANDEVRNGAMATAAAVAIVPHPALDAAVVLWRSLVMTRRISTIYGLRPGGLATWKLLSHTLKSAFLAAGMNAIAGMIADGGGAAGIANAVKPFAAGAVIGVRMYRLGSLCISICRPI